ncbi:hypothetical protein [Dokdonella sp.]|uniref:hypothetical protein n=1 Tax=Dokdonella sp. TaxID=2291710 RepID=UPI0031C02DC9|nr:hypothetical protein [Dokdonella sp.]
MRWLVPFHRLSSVHLGLGLRVARIVAWLGYLLVALAILMFVFVGLGVGSSRPGGFLAMPLRALSSFILFGWAMACLAIASLLAALVGIEENLRRASESR